MSQHVFYPAPEMPAQIVAYVHGMQAQASTFGNVTGNSPADLAPLLAGAQTLEPKAQEIEDLQIQLAAKLDAYHKAAAPIWAQFSEALHYAHTFGEKHELAALLTFLLAFRHNHGRHKAKTEHTAQQQQQHAQPPKA